MKKYPLHSGTASDDIGISRVKQSYSDKRYINFVSLTLSLLLSSIFTTFFVINPGTSNEFRSATDILASLVSTSANILISHFMIFVAVFLALCLTIRYFRITVSRIRLLSTLMAAIFAWSWTIPGFPSDNYPWPNIDSKIWYSIHLQTFYAIKWFIITVVLTVIITGLSTFFLRFQYPRHRQEGNGDGPHIALNSLSSRILDHLSFDVKSVSILAGIIFCFWVPVLLINSPAQVFVDTIGELLMFRTPVNVQLPGFRLNGVWIDGQHPPFDTLVFGLVDNVGRACGNELAAFVVLTWLQSIALAFSVALLFCWINTKTQTPRLVRLFILFVICLSGLFPMTSSVIMKDSLWLPFFIVWITVFAETVRRVFSRQKIGWGLVTTLILSSIFAGLTKKTSIYITTISLIAPIFIPKCRNRKKIILSALLPAVIVLAVVPVCVYRPLNISSGNPAEVIAVPLQQVTKTVMDHPTEVGKEDRNIINRVMDLEKAEQSFTPQTSVPIKPYYKRGQVNHKDMIRFLGVWIKLGLKHPRSYTSAVPYLWDAFVPGRIMIDGLYPIREGWPELTQKVILPSIPDHAYSWQQQHLAPILYNGMRAIPPWNLICDVSFYVLDIPLISLYICILKRRYQQLVFLVPAALNILVQFVIQTAEPRLSLAMLALFPLICAAPWIANLKKIDPADLHFKG